MDPEVVPNFEMSFESFEDAFFFYKKYARRVGFPIKRTGKGGQLEMISVARWKGSITQRFRMATVRRQRLQNVMAARQWCAQERREVEGVSFLHALFSNITTS